MSSIGESMRRKEDPRMITGRGRYTEDINLPGMLHMVVVRSPEAHAAITSIDASAARERDGVVAVLTGEDMAGDFAGPCPWSGCRRVSRSRRRSTGRSSAARSSTWATPWPWWWPRAATWRWTRPRT